MAQRILEVPKVKQRPNHCGPACLSMIFAFIGKDLSQEDIVDLMELDPQVVGKEGVFDDDIIYAAERVGYKAFQYYNLSLRDICRFIDNGLPLIVPCRSDRFDGHYYVLKGYETNPQERVFVNDPGDLRRGQFQYKPFCRDWDWGKKTGIIVSEKRKRLPRL